jgi:hypothetical protein
MAFLCQKKWTPAERVLNLQLPEKEYQAKSSSSEGLPVL